VAAVDLKVAFGEVIRELRLAAGLSQERLSLECGRHRTFVSLIERGKNAPSITTLWVLSESLGVTPSDVIHQVERRLAVGTGRSQTRRRTTKRKS
jgi:transcriptional regulator with XRE-family HTH domain